MAEQKRKNVNVNTEVGTFKFPKLNTPDTKYKAEGEYGVKLILSEEEAGPIVEQMKAEAQKIFEATKVELTERFNAEKGEKKAKAKKELEGLKLADLPVKDCVDDDGEPNGDVELNFKMKATRQDKKTGKIIIQKPKFFDAEGKAIANPPSVWGGTRGCVAGQIVPYYTAAVGAGTSLRLSAVQIIELVNGSGGTAESFGFGKKEGFVAEKEEASGFTDKSSGGDDAVTDSGDDDF